jgi:wobble nucleotide-excising tRNase
LSAGDRRTLALAYFFASLENNTNLKNAIVVFDDPFTSLDEHRMEATAAEICKLQDQCRQMIIVSHSAPFLEKIYDLTQWNPGVCEKAEKTRRLPLCLRLSRRGDQNSLKEWGIEELKRTAYDISFASVLDYCERRENDIKAVAHNLRPVLEGYCRVAFQPYYRPGMLLGPFCEEMASRQETQTARVEFDLRELQELTNYANRFQHHRDVSPLLNEREFETYARRILKFVGYKLEK